MLYSSLKILGRLLRKKWCCSGACARLAKLPCYLGEGKIPPSQFLPRYLWSPIIADSFFERMHSISVGPLKAGQSCECPLSLAYFLVSAFSALKSRFKFVCGDTWSSLPNNFPLFVHVIEVSTRVLLANTLLIREMISALNRRPLPMQ